MRQFLLNSSIISSILAVSPLVQLTEDNFESTLEQYDDILINFYSPWATNWKSMQPHFEAVAPVMAASKPSYFVGVVNCNIEKVLCYRYTDTSGYPDPVLLNFNRRTAEQKIEANKTNAELREKYEAEQLAKQEEALVIDAQTGEPVEDETKNKPDQETDPEKIAENARVKQAKLDRDMKLLHLDYDIQKYTGGKIGILMYQTLMGDRKKVNEITSVEEFRKLTSQQLVNVAIAFLDGSKQEKAPGFKALHMAADQLSTEKYFQIVKTRIYYTFDAEVIKAAGLNSHGKIIFYKALDDVEEFEDREIIFDKNGKFTLGLIRNFIREHSIGLAPVIRPEEKSYIEYPFVITIFDINPKEDLVDRVEKEKLARRVTRKASRDLSQKYSTKFVLGDKQAWREVMYDFKIKAHEPEFQDKFPFSVVYEDEWTRYVMPESLLPFSEENFYNFMHKHERREIPVYVKSEDEPANDKSEEVLVLTANNYEKYVNGEQDVFIKFYAPWCGHCRKLAPYYEKLAKMLKPSRDNGHLLIAKFDVDANDVPPGIEIKGVPALYWVKAGKPIKQEVYKESRDPVEIIKFLEENATHKPQITTIEQLDLGEKEMADAMEEAKKMANQAMKDMGSEADFNKDQAEDIAAKMMQKMRDSKKGQKTEEKEDLDGSCGGDSDSGTCIEPPADEEKAVEKDEL